METLANLQQKIRGAEDLKSVVKAMKAMAASKIGQYETAVDALTKYNETIGLGIRAYFTDSPTQGTKVAEAVHKNKTVLHCAIVFGSDQGLVGQFNDTLADFTSNYLTDLPGKKEVWVIGERMALKLADLGFASNKTFLLPSAVEAITPLVRQLLNKSEQHIENGSFQAVHLFYNQPKKGVGYTAVTKQLLPLNNEWKQSFLTLPWPNKCIPGVVGDKKKTFLSLVHEFLFALLYRACAASLASENASRLLAMQRAEKNIAELLSELNDQYHRLRQALIDEELFDVISGFESLKKKQ